jgi:AcrR family transcriptional regulator
MGRPKAFDEEATLSTAMRTFWRFGYSRTTLDDLVAEMGINRPSLYATYGDKAQLFRLCLDRYAATITEERLRELFAHRAWDQAVAAYLRGWVHIFTDPQLPGGCLLASHLDDESMQDGETRFSVQTHASASEKTLRMRLDAAASDGQLDSRHNRASLARTILCFLAGLSTLSRHGTSRRLLLGAVDHFVFMLKTFSPPTH